MNRTITLTIAVMAMIVNCAKADDHQYKSMLTDGTEWYYRSVIGNRPFDTDPLTHSMWGKHIVKGDTIVNGKTFKKIAHMYATPFTDTYHYDPDTDTDPYLAYEDDGKLYLAYYSDYLEKWIEYLYMDFNLRQGDLTYWGGEDALTMQVVKEDTITVRGEQYRRLKFRYLQFTDGPVWVEGIGSPTFDSAYNDPVITGAKPVYTEYRRNGQTIFTYHDFFTDNGQTTITTITTDSTDAPTYDLLGRRVTNPRPGTPVIRAGRLLRL